MGRIPPSAGRSLIQNGVLGLAQTGRVRNYATALLVSAVMLVALLLFLR